MSEIRGVPNSILGKFAYAAHKQGIDFPHSWLWIAPQGNRVAFYSLRNGFEPTDLLDEILAWDLTGPDFPF